MAIYKRDMIQTPDGKRHGEELTGDTIRLAYRMSGSITTNGVTYKFSHSDPVTGEAVYIKSDAQEAQQVQSQVQRIIHQVQSRIERSAPPVVETGNVDIPSGAILDADFVGGRKHHNGRVYRLAQPVRQINGKYVYVEAEK